MPFNFEQQLYAISWLVVTGNARESARKVEEKYHMAPPDHKTVINWKNKLEETGCLGKNRPGQGRRATESGDTGCEEVLSAASEAMAATSPTSVRQISRQTGKSATTVWRILKKSGVRHWKPKVRQQLNDGDEDRRVEFCELMIERIENEDDFVNRLVFADEANFHLTGHVNRHNCFYYSVTDPNVIWEKPVNSPRVCVWAAISNSGVISFKIVRNNMDGDNFLSICEENIKPIFLNDPTKILVQDGAPCHYSKRVRNFLNEFLPQRWIGRRGNFCEYPPRSPDLTVCDYFLWGYLRELVYRGDPIRNLDQLEEKIASCLLEIPEDMCQNAFDNFRERCNLCLMNNGSHFE